MHIQFTIFIFVESTRETGILNNMKSLEERFTKNLQLGISAFVVIVVGLIYGFNPSKILPSIFGFEAEDLELKNIFRAIMGLYIVLGIYWIIGIVKTQHWRTATIINILFMGGLALGRLISTIVDGFSYQFGIGMVLEAIIMCWGMYNLKKYNY